MEREKQELTPVEHDVFNGADPFRYLWDHHENILKLTPERSVYWGLDNTRAEANEWCETDPVLTPQEFRDEGADIIISWFGTMKGAGYSYEDAAEIIRLKTNIVIDRMIRTNDLMRRTGMSFNEAYPVIKQLEKDEKKGEVNDSSPS